ncbi:MAG: isocitrate lyase/phosphoenolpyruvate mutase family protein [Deltaproteobacteria bacterium]|nr:isocitrate lyase/phosphoenolpyruvate mutase family protein [Deltaproteobacteria bacterium]
MRQSKASLLRQRLRADGPVLVAGAHNGISAVIAERAGFDALWASGFEISASFAVPDANILTMADNVAVAKAIDNASSLPVIADCDNGYGNAINVIRTVEEYEKAGVAAICMEDNIFPKRCSFYAGVKRELESVEEFAGKIRAGKDAQRDPDFMIIARTEALIAGWGMEEALKRARAYADAGADMCLIHSKSKTPDEVLAFAKAWDRPTPLVCVPTIYKDTTADELAAAGFKVVIYANHGMRAAIKAMREALGAIKKERKAAAAEPWIVKLDEVYDLVGVDRMTKQEKEFLPGGGRQVRAVVLAAGSGKALGAAARDLPKAMLDLKGKTVLERQVAALNAVGVKDIAVVRGYQAAKFNVPNIKYYENPDYETTGEMASLARAAGEMKGMTLVLYGDLLFDRGVVEKALQSEADLTVVVDRTFQESREQLTERPRLDLVELSEVPSSGPRALASDAPLVVARIGHALEPTRAHAEFVGMLVVTERGARLLMDSWARVTERYAGKPFHEASNVERASLTDVLQQLIDEGTAVHAVETFKGWMEIDTFEDYQRAWAAVR